MTATQTPISKQARQVLWLQDQKPGGSNGGASAVATLPNGQVRDLNTVRKNTIPGASLDSVTGFFTLPAGLGNGFSVGGEIEIFTDVFIEKVNS